MLEDGNEVGAVFFDLTKAFDSVPHRKLLGKLQELGLNAYIVNWISDYLTNRTQSVVLNGVSSTTLPVLSGVPQGSILGPLLFLMYLNDINDTTISSGSKLVLEPLPSRPLSGRLLRFTAGCRHPGCMELYEVTQVQPVEM